MPELPEVETTVRGLARFLDGARIERVTLGRPDMRFPFPAGLGQSLTGARVLSLGRRAKYGLIDRPEFFAWLEGNWKDVFAGGQARTRAIATSCRAKAAVVADDERESGVRALLNLGHTFGHALEAATGYDSARLVHGEGVAIGMALAHRFSARLNLASPDDAGRVETHLAAVGLPTRLSDVPGDLPGAERLLTYIAQDKKVSRGALTFILTHGIGRSFVAKDVPTSQVLSFLEESLSQ